jgi:hypothetical protein
MAHDLAEQGHEVIIVDNNSTYEPLLDFYSMLKCEVVRLKENLGHKAPWLAGVVDSGDYYAVTDPDLDISMIPKDWPFLCIDGIRTYGVEKCGFSLDETLVPTQNPAYLLDEFYKFPQGNPAVWGIPLEEGKFYNAPVDTTFAVYAPKVTKHHVSGIRTGRPYTARHLPWHLVLDYDPKEQSIQIPMDDEYYNYFKTASDASQTKKRMDMMIWQYEIRKSL